MGLENVSGEYISFLDSDDWLDLNALKNLYSEAEKSSTDLIFFKLLVYNEKEKTYNNTEYYDLTVADEFFNGSIYNYTDLGDKLFEISVTAYNKFYRSEFLKDANITFSEGLIFEDNPFFFKSMIMANKILFKDEYCLFRRIREDSIITSRNEKYFDCIPITNEIINFFKDNKLYDNYKKEILNYKFSMIKNNFNNVHEEFKENFLELIRKDFFNPLNCPPEDCNKYLSICNLSFYLNTFEDCSLEEFEILYLKDYYKRLYDASKEDKQHLLEMHNELIISQKGWKDYSTELRDKIDRFVEEIEDLKDKVDDSINKNKDLRNENKDLMYKFDKCSNRNKKYLITVKNTKKRAFKSESKVIKLNKSDKKQKNMIKNLKTTKGWFKYKTDNLLTRFKNKLK